MDLLTAMQTMNACRYYKSDAVDEAVLAKVMNAARWAATGSNKQPLSFIAVRDPAKRQALHDPHTHARLIGGQRRRDQRVPIA